MIKALIAFVLTMILVIGIHELGHSLAAWFFKVKISRISIGFGKPILTWTSGSGCEWIWALWPLGGYVKLLNSRIEAVPDNQYPYCFDKQSVSVRILILSAGILANLITALVTFTLIFMLGFKQYTAVIQNVLPDTPALKAGLVAQDRILTIDNQKAESWSDASVLILMNLNNPKLSLEVMRESGRIDKLTINLQNLNFNKPKTTLFTAIGFQPASLTTNQTQIPGLPFVKAVEKAIAKSVQMSYLFLIMLKQIMTGQIPFALLIGPLGLFALSIQSLMEGITVFLYFIAHLSLSVALINLLPIPGLDGASILYSLLEKWRGKPLSIALELLLYRITMILFFLLLFQLGLNDLRRYLT